MISSEKLLEFAMSDEFDYGVELNHDFLKNYFEVKPTFDEKDGVLNYDDFCKLRDKEEWENLTCITALKDFLIEKRKMKLVTRRTFGYTVIQPNEQASYAVNELAKGIDKLVKKCQKTIGNINKDKLTREEKMEAVRYEDHVRRLNSVIDKSVKKLN